MDYDRRHGYRGPEAYVTLPEDAAEQENVLERVFQEASDYDKLITAVVLEASSVEVERSADGDIGPSPATAFSLRRARSATRMPPGPGSAEAP